MNKCKLLLPIIAIVVFLQACKSDPNGPGDPVIMASYFDSSLVDVTGTWHLIADPPGNISMSVSSSSLQWFSPDRLPYSGIVDKTLNRSIITKHHGVEREATIYGIRIDGKWWTMAVRNQDSISIGACDSDPERAAIAGNYVRVR